MEKKEIYKELSKNEFIERKDEVIAGLNAEYSKNHTISGLLNNVFDHYSKEYSDEAFYQYFKREKPTRSWGKEYDHVVLYSNSNILYREHLMKSIYNQLVNFHPFYDNIDVHDREQEVWERLREEVIDPKYVPLFVTSSNFYYPRYIMEKNLYNSESKKVYLNIGQENYDLLFYDIFKLYIDYRTEVDKDIENHRETNTNQFKVRTEYGNDGVVFRFRDNNQYEIFKEVLSKNKKILESLRSSNPFLPIEYINGHPFNVLPDKGASYNSYISHSIELYILDCIKKGESANIKDFLKFIKENVISMEKIDEHHYSNGSYEIYNDIVIEQVEKELTKTRN